MGVPASAAAGGVSTQRGQIFRTEGGLWAIRYRDAHGRRPQQTGFRTKGEAHTALEEALSAFGSGRCTDRPSRCGS